jgi:hypothetical protein
MYSKSVTHIGSNNFVTIMTGRKSRDTFPLLIRMLRKSQQQDTLFIGLVRITRNRVLLSSIELRHSNNHLETEQTTRAVKISLGCRAFHLNIEIITLKLNGSP